MLEWLLPSQDDLLWEEAGDGAGLLCHQQVHRAGHLSCGAEVGNSVGMVLKIGDQPVQVLGSEDRLDKIGEWLKALTFLASVSGKDDHFHHFAESFVVLLINQERIP